MGPCSNIGCGHRVCWIEEAHVTELTSLLRQGPTGDQLAGLPTAPREPEHSPTRNRLSHRLAVRVGRALRAACPRCSAVRRMPAVR
jgi:hypothetical protein